MLCVEGEEGFEVAGLFLVEMGFEVVHNGVWIVFVLDSGAGPTWVTLPHDHEIEGGVSDSLISLEGDFVQAVLVGFHFGHSCQ